MSAYYLFRVIDDQGNVVIGSQGGTSQNITDASVFVPNAGQRNYTLQAYYVPDGTQAVAPEIYARALSAQALYK